MLRRPVDLYRMDPETKKTSWGDATSFLRHPHRAGWADVLLVIGLVGIFLAMLSVGKEIGGPFRPSVQIDLSPWALPRYTLYSLARGLIAFVLSIAFTLAYGYWAAHDRLAERVLVPLLDILQSIPVLGFMPGVLLFFVALFPTSNLGLELTSILMVFTGQVWNMTFSFYHSLRSIPRDMNEATAVYQLSWWQRLRWVEVPFSMIGLVWNGMMSMAGGWFFLMITESIVLGNRDYRLPGIGSYMTEAVAQGNVTAMLSAILAMVVMIVALDQLFWRPVVAWAQKFRVEEGGQQEEVTSWFGEFLARTELLGWVSAGARAVVRALAWRLHRPGAAPNGTLRRLPRPSSRAPSYVLMGLLALVVGVGAWRLGHDLVQVSGGEWEHILSSAAATLGRVAASTALGTLWALPAGMAIGLSPKVSRYMQPVVQIAASFPAPMLFPLVISGLALAGVSLGWGSILLMLLGTQWYILFNVVAGAMAVPSDLKEASRSYGLSRWERFRILYFPVLFPYLITGWVTAAGGAWNASIVAEYVVYRGHVYTSLGLGSAISEAAASADFPVLAASVLVMAAVVVLVNRTVWRRLYHLAEQRYSLTR